MARRGGGGPHMYYSIYRFAFAFAIGGIIYTYQVKVVVVAMRCVQSTAVGLGCHAR